MEEFVNINNIFHQMIAREEWNIEKTDVAELYLNDAFDNDKEDGEWQAMDGLTIMFVPGYGRLQMIWIEENNG